MNLFTKQVDSGLVTFGEAYQFLLHSVQSTRDSLHQLELNYRRSMNDLVQKYHDAKAQLEQK